jgi:hypothetical protein
MRGRSVRGSSLRDWAAGSGLVWAATAGLVLWAATAGAAPTQPGQLTNAMQAADECNKCHAFANQGEQAAEPFVTPVAWQATMMGLAARDPVFWAAWRSPIRTSRGRPRSASAVMRRGPMSADARRRSGSTSCSRTT